MLNLRLPYQILLENGIQLSIIASYREESTIQTDQAGNEILMVPFVSTLENLEAIRWSSLHDHPQSATTKMKSTVQLLGKNVIYLCLALGLDSCELFDCSAIIPNLLVLSKELDAIAADEVSNDSSHRIISNSSTLGGNHDEIRVMNDLADDILQLKEIVATSFSRCKEGHASNAADSLLRKHKESKAALLSDNNIEVRPTKDDLDEWDLV